MTATDLFRRATTGGNRATGLFRRANKNEKRATRVFRTAFIREKWKTELFRTLFIRENRETALFRTDFIGESRQTALFRIFYKENSYVIASVAKQTSLRGHSPKQPRHVIARNLQPRGTKRAVTKQTRKPLDCFTLRVRNDELDCRLLRSSQLKASLAMTNKK